MLIYDRQDNCCAAFEVKHSRQAVSEQARHLRDEEKCALTERRFGHLVGRYVLYLGEDLNAGDGVIYRNAEKFLTALPEITMRAEMVQAMIDTEQNSGQGFRPTM